jgi:GT2 family glycosyltransferase
MTSLPVSILIVNYNGEKHIAACLMAVESQTYPRSEFEVIVVDNASRDQSLAVIRQFPTVILHASAINLGFAEGNNTAARMARGQTLVLLNNDTIPDPFWLEELMRAVHRNPWGLAVSKLVFAHDPKLIHSTGLVLLRDGRGADRGFREPDIGQYEVEEPVFAGCGAALAMPAPKPGETIFDPYYFIYYEDLDYQWQSTREGRVPTYAPRSLVRHVHGAAAGDRSAIFHYYVERNRAITALRNGDAFLAFFSGLVLIAKVAESAVSVILRRSSPKGQWPVFYAIARAAVVYLISLPRYLGERQRIRTGS